MEEMEYIKIPLHGKLGEGKYALVDGDYDGEYFSQYRWYLLKNGYPARAKVEEKAKDRTKYVYLHQEVAGVIKGLWIDHIDRDKLNNRSCNLRHVTPSENARNRIQNAKGRDNGYKGVNQRVRRNGKRNNLKAPRYYATCARVHLGTFDTPREAAEAYDRRARELWGDLAVLNFPNS